MTVFAVQQQMKYDQDQRKLVERFTSIKKAERFGPLEYLLGPSANPFKSELALGDLHEKLKNFNDDDYLLLIGNPALIGMATTVAAHYNNGSVKFLQWSGRHGDYSEISLKII